jgi:hypothetical protein
MLLSLVTGASFTLGVVVIIIAYQMLKDHWAEDRRSWIGDPEDLRIVEHEVVPNQNRFTVRGTIENSGDYLWSIASVNIRLFAGQAQVNACNDDVWEIPPNSTRDFELYCRGVSGINLPTNIRYEIGVSSGSRVNW